MLLRFHIYLFNCAINVRAYVCVFCVRACAMERRNGKMIVETVDDEPDIEQTFEYPWDKNKPTAKTWL